MRIVKIELLKNGAHSNQTTGKNIQIPDGWAVVPDDMETPNFPFGEVTAEKIDGVMTVTKWVAGTMPEHKEIVPEPSAIEQLRADVDYIAVMTGVDL